MNGTDRGRYTCVTRVGNWWEEMVLEDEKMREFLEKKEMGTLTIQRIRQNLSNVNMPPPPQSKYLHYDQMIRIVNQELGSYLACDPGDVENEEEKMYSVSGSRQPEPTARNVWVLTRYEKGNGFLPLPTEDEEDNVVHYGDEFYLQTTDAMGSEPYYLASYALDWAHFSRVSRKQLVYSTQEKSFRSIWRIESIGRDTAMDMDGEPVHLGDKIFIKHQSTGSPLACRDTTILNDYGSEYEVVGAREPGRRMIWAFTAE